MTAPYRFPDVQQLLIDGLEAVAGAGRVAVETPPDLEAQLPFVRVRRAAGHSDRLTDFSSVQIDVFAALYATAEGLAEDIRQWLVGPPPPVVQLDRADCVAAPQELPWDPQSPVRRFGATYQVQARRRLTA